MIESLSVRNFKGHEKLDVEFPPGLTLITGANASGKSTLLHAILFGFWGVSAVPGGAKRVPTRGGKPGDTSVTLRFFHNNETYTVERKLSTASLYRGNTLIATGLSPVSKELESVIGIPAKYFYALKSVEQGHTQALLTLGVSELHKIIEQVSGAQVVNRVIFRASDIASQSTSVLAALGEAPDTASLKKTLVEREAELTSLKEQEAELDQLSSGLEANLEKTKKRLFQADERNRLIEEVDNGLAHFEPQLSQIDRQLEEEEAKLTNLAKTAGRATTLDALAKQLTWQLGQWGAAEAKQVKLERALADATEAVHRVDESSRENTTPKSLEPVDIVPILDRHAEAGAKLRSAEDKLSEVESGLVKAICPTCKRPFSVEHAKELSKDRKALAQEVADLREDYDALCEEVRSARELERLYKIAVERETQAKNALAAARAHLGHVKVEWNDFVAECEQLVEVDEAQVKKAQEEAAAAQQAAGYYHASVKAAERLKGLRSDVLAKIEQLRKMRPQGVKTDLDDLKAEVDKQSRRTQRHAGKARRASLVSYEYRDRAGEAERSLGQSYRAGREDPAPHAAQAHLDQAHQVPARQP